MVIRIRRVIFWHDYVTNRELEPVRQAGKNPEFAKPCRMLGRVDQLAECHRRSNIAHRLSTTVGNLIAFFG
jgi:hypothetical protein